MLRVLAALGLVVTVVIALGVAWMAVALPVLLLLGLAAGLVAGPTPAVAAAVRRLTQFAPPSFQRHVPLLFLRPGG
jgi:hypothetical protein